MIRGEKRGEGARKRGKGELQEEGKREGRDVEGTRLLRLMGGGGGRVERVVYFCISFYLHTRIHMYILQSCL